MNEWINGVDVFGCFQKHLFKKPVIAILMVLSLQTFSLWPFQSQMWWLALFLIQVKNMPKVKFWHDTDVVHDRAGAGPAHVPVRLLVYFPWIFQCIFNQNNTNKCFLLKVNLKGFKKNQSYFLRKKWTVLITLTGFAVEILYFKTCCLSKNIITLGGR